MLGNTPSLLKAGFISECWWSVLPESLASMLHCSLTTSHHTSQEQSQVSNAFPPWCLLRRTFPTPSVSEGMALLTASLHLLSLGFWPSPHCPGPSTLPHCTLLYPPSHLTFPAASQSSVLFSTISQFLTSTFVSYHF